MLADNANAATAQTSARIVKSFPKSRRRPRPAAHSKNHRPPPATHDPARAVFAPAPPPAPPRNAPTPAPSIRREDERIMAPNPSTVPHAADQRPPGRTRPTTM